LIINIPLLFLLILLSTLFRPGVLGLSFIFGITGWPGIARQVRGRVLSERERDYVLAALVAGARDLRIMYRHILPNVFSVVLVIAGFGVGGAILGEAGLSFLGLGDPNVVSWGAMLNDGRAHLFDAPHLVLFPALAVMLAVLSFNFIGDALRDAVETRLQKR